MNNFNETAKKINDPQILDEQIQSLMVGDQWHRHGEALILLRRANAQIKYAEIRLAERDKRIHELENLASTDPLTGLLNRRGFESFFAQEQERARRHNTFGSVMIL